MLHSASVNPGGGFTDQRYKRPQTIAIVGKFCNTLSNEMQTAMHIAEKSNFSQKRK